MISVFKTNYTKDKIDFRMEAAMDELTMPTDEMREGIIIPEIGADVYQEDPTINKLEELAAKKIGKEAALFLPSGTMCNLVAVLTYCNRGDEIILEAGAHMLYYEVGGMSALAGVMPRTIVGNRGIITPKQIEEALLDENTFFRKTKLICLENPHNRAGGLVIPLKNMKDIYQTAHKHNISVYLDGARIFNAAAALDVDVSVVAKYSDSVMFCLSKGLGVPIGAILSGSKEFVEKAKKYRQMLGGVMRQAGVLAASGIIALETMVDRLKEDQKNAWILGESLNKITGVEVDLETVQTNMVFIDVKNLGIDTDEFLKKLLKFDILASPRRPTEIRFITHLGISSEDINKTIKAVTEIAKNKLVL